MKSTLSNMVFVLFVITLVASTAVGLVYNVTVEPISLAKAVKVKNAIGVVLPAFDNDPSQNKIIKTIDGSDVTIYMATQGADTVGYAIETFSNNGFGGTMKLMVGLLPDGTINKIETLQHGETPGLGDKIDGKKSKFSVQFEGKNPETFRLKVKKDDGDVDAITASTISSRAYTDAVQRAYDIYKSLEK